MIGCGLTRLCRSCPGPSPRSSGHGRLWAESALTRSSNSPPGSLSACSDSPAETQTCTALTVNLVILTKYAVTAVVSCCFADEVL